MNSRKCKRERERNRGPADVEGILLALVATQSDYHGKWCGVLYIGRIGVRAWYRGAVERVGAERERGRDHVCISGKSIVLFDEKTRSTRELEFFCFIFFCHTIRSFYHFQRIGISVR